ncbi:T6SS phospholipase effector Tle1-like catalytic domain-containing protein [Pseudomonas rubra]|uniref:DUF2235 domain-containing protein n=1 Tax=Pseudomonas rubra TaxID=2942627 RepID=A0ABT5PDW6_9PSED|nr:DUF2235 domain-containing protein [Pseudomonas rubra]MDD1016448.1 DUF2235 domain-containing protein [Pseudomonas rubra]MDD1036577.1 DUF2235 domain-containing protein [Pseudomonas rubra]MDD1156511.1 DUF2235 domain-containing protein [Pseudomonas rubra]
MNTGITLRIGVFFDGTGNNLANSTRSGYDRQGNAPDNSYGNDKTNVARLYELYQHRGEDALKVYVEGIGTTSAGDDSALAKATGRYATGVIARAQQAHDKVLNELSLWCDENPQVKVAELQFDLFGFSRGAAAARHFANDLHKGQNSGLAKRWPARLSLLCDDFDWDAKDHLNIQFIGLFDSVAAIVALLKGNFSPANADYSGVEMKLEAGIARKVVQLVARDELRKNFPLTRTGNDITVPGAHSDVGGGYPARVREQVVLARPRSSVEPRSLANERSQAYRQMQQDGLDNHLAWQALPVQRLTWSEDLPFVPKRDLYPQKRVVAWLRCEREVFAGLSLIYLRIMHALGLRNGARLRALDDRQSPGVPVELRGIATKLSAYALGEQPVPGLTAAEEALLRSRYIHLSSHWNRAGGLVGDGAEVMFFHRPGDNGQRRVFPNE